MKVRLVKKDKLSDGFEWDFGHGLSSYVTGQNAIKQDIECSLYEWENDCYFALNNGINWRERLGQKKQKDLLDNDIINTIQERYGVLAVNDFVSYVTDRSYSCQCEVFTIFTDNFTFTFSKEV